MDIRKGLLTGRAFHTYIRPTVKITEEAEKIHGLHKTYLKKKYDDYYDNEGNNTLASLQFI